MAEVEIPHGEGKEGEKQIGIMIAIIAVVMAIVGALGNNAANERIVKAVESSNGFAWYQAKRQRSYLNDLEIKRIAIELAGTPTAAQREALTKLATDLKAKNEEYHSENEKLQKDALEAKIESEVSGEKNDGFDHAEILLQVAVVLCSLTLLTSNRNFLRVGIAVAILGGIWGGKTLVLKAHPPGGEHAAPAAHAEPAAHAAPAK